MVFDIRDPSQLSLTTSPLLRTAMTGSKITAAIWGPLDKTIITGHEQGEVCQWEVRTDGQCLKRNKSHEGLVNDIQVYKRYIEETMFITASKDRTAKVRSRLIYRISSNIVKCRNKIYFFIHVHSMQTEFV